MQEVSTEIERVGRWIKVEDMKEVWKRYSDLLEKKEKARRIRISREIICETISYIISKEERDNELLLELEVNREITEGRDKKERILGDQKQDGY